MFYSSVWWNLSALLVCNVVQLDKLSTRCHLTAIYTWKSNSTNEDYLICFLVFFTPVPLIDSQSVHNNPEVLEYRQKVTGFLVLLHLLFKRLLQIVIMGLDFQAYMSFWEHNKFLTHCILSSLVLKNVRCCTCFKKSVVVEPPEKELRLQHDIPR